MDEYIKRKDAFEILQSRLDSISQMSYLNMDRYELDIMRNAIENAIDDIGEVPSADVQPIRRGRWELTNNPSFRKCSECGAWWGKEFTINNYVNYCPRCGADMRELNE